MFLIDNLWTIFEVAREERTDGDNFEGDMSVAPDLFLNAIKGNEAFSCMADVDKDELLKQWEAEDQAVARAEYKAIVGTDPANREASRYKELSAAFTADNRDAFEKIKADAVAELTAAEGV